MRLGEVHAIPHVGAELEAHESRQRFTAESTEHEAERDQRDACARARLLSPWRSHGVLRST
jgi:hypothetical protein